MTREFMRGGAADRRLRWLQSCTAMRQITGAGEPSSRSSNYCYFFLAAFFSLLFSSLPLFISLRVV